MKRFLALTLVFAMVALAVPMPANAATSGEISGVVRSTSMIALQNFTVRAHDVMNGVVGTTSTTNGLGQFRLAGLKPGSYVIEVVDRAGHVLATSASISLKPSAMSVAGVAVTAAEPQAAAAAGGGAAMSATMTAVIIAAIGAGVMTAAIVATGGTKSPSK